MKTLLKKTGIVVAATTAGLLAFSPLALANNNTNNNNQATNNNTAPAGDCNITQSTGDATQTVVLGLLSNLNDVGSDIQTAAPICDNNVNLQVIPIESPVTQNNQ